VVLEHVPVHDGIPGRWAHGVASEVPAFVSLPVDLDM
jgi:hypothetical protein